MMNMEEVEDRRFDMFDKIEDSDQQDEPVITDDGQVGWVRVLCSWTVITWMFLRHAWAVSMFDGKGEVSEHHMSSARSTRTRN